MKKITLQIPDNKFDFFLKLINELGIEASENEIPDEHKTIVRERVKKSNKNPERLSDWSQEMDSFRIDNEL